MSTTEEVCRARRKAILGLVEGALFAIIACHKGGTWHNVRV